MRIITIVALCCMVQMCLWALATFFILPATQFSSSSNSHHDDDSSSHAAITQRPVKKTRGGTPMHPLVRPPAGGKKIKNKKDKKNKNKNPDDDHDDSAPSPPSVAGDAHPATTKCKKLRGRGCGHPASSSSNGLLSEPFFDLFSSSSSSSSASTHSSSSQFTIADLATIPQEQFLSATFSKIEHRPITKSRSPGTFAKKALVLIISNEDFLDGAMVLGASLLNNSKQLTTGEAELLLIVTENRISEDSKRRLREVGFSVICSVPSLARFVPGAALKDTFDKIFMFALVMFERVVFMDADMLAVKSPDELFTRRFAPSQDVADRWVGAIGFRDSREGDYFQTGMIVFQPTQLTFARVLDRFARNIPPRGRLYNVGMNGRDGVLVRDVFGSNFTEFSNKYSRNLNPRNHIPAEVVALHFRGRHKMWYDKRWPLVNADINSKKEFGFNYVAWWRMYEELHRRSEDYKIAMMEQQQQQQGSSSAAAKDASGNLFGGTSAGAGISARTHVWMMRHTKREYVQLLHDVEAERLKLTLPKLQLTAGQLGESCDAVCAAKQLACVPAALNWTQPNSCAVLGKFFEECADGCEMGVYWRPHPGREFPGLDTRPLKGGGKKNKNKKDNKLPGRKCVFNFRHDERCFPTCGAFNETTRRLCPCAPESSLSAEPVAGDPELML